MLDGVILVLHNIYTKRKNRKHRRKSRKEIDNDDNEVIDVAQRNGNH